MIITISGESGSGKSTLMKALLNKGYKQTIAYTTRPKRTGEVNGVDYHFVSDKEFKELRNKGFFAEVGCYNNWKYASAKKSYETDDNIIVVLTPQGVRQIKKNLRSKQIFSVYLSIDRRSRLIQILTRGDDIDEACRRSASDVGMFTGFDDECDYILNNDEYQYTPEELASILDNQVKNNRYNHQVSFIKYDNANNPILNTEYFTLDKVFEVWRKAHNSWRREATSAQVIDCTESLLTLVSPIKQVYLLNVSDVVAMINSTNPEWSIINRM